MPSSRPDRANAAAECKPGAASVVHHILVYIVPPGQQLRLEKPGAVLSGMAPGEMPLRLEPGMAKKVPAGSRLVFQMHYTPDGQPHTDRSSCGIIFAKEPPKFQVLTLPVHNLNFILGRVKIPAGAANFQVEADHTFREDVRLLNFV